MCPPFCIHILLFLCMLWISTWRCGWRKPALPSHDHLSFIRLMHGFCPHQQTTDGKRWEALFRVYSKAYECNWIGIPSLSIYEKPFVTEILELPFTGKNHSKWQWAIYRQKNLGAHFLNLKFSRTKFYILRIFNKARNHGLKLGFCT